MKIACICGARPNFIKIAALMRELKGHPELEHLLVHTGQHYDERMSGLFFDQLQIPRPDINLEVGSGSHAQQTAEIMKRFEAVCLSKRPTHVLVVGDVNSTIACALVASKLGIKVIHVEAGLRSFDRAMPEEVNRVLTDHISDLLFATEESGVTNLLNEGISKDKVHMVGNVMIDTLLHHLKRAESSPILSELGLLGKNASASGDNDLQPYSVVTLHRPSNVDTPKTLGNILGALREIANKVAVIFPVHPRTLQRFRDFGLEREFVTRSVNGGAPCTIGSINCIEPLGYLEFLRLMAKSRFVVTDSGGIQEETTVLGVPCVTVRDNTERPATITCGTNRLVGSGQSQIIDACLDALQRWGMPSSKPPLWDGHASERIVNILSGSR